MRRGAKLLYGSGEFMNGTSSVIVVMLFLKFLTDVVGLEPIWAGGCATFVVPWSALPEIIDLDRFAHGRSREGIFNG